MAKGYHLTPEVKDLIAHIYLDHPGYGPTKIHEELLNRMKETGLDKKYGSDWPGVSAVGKVVAEIRERDIARPPELKRLGSPWSLGSLTEYPIPPEALPTVVSFYKKRLAEGGVLLIREALWTARLYKLSDPPDLVWDWASLYALYEELSELQDKPFDSRGWDKLILSAPHITRNLLEIMHMALDMSAEEIEEVTRLVEQDLEEMRKRRETK